jgi:hypothetical protein
MRCCVTGVLCARIGNVSQGENDRRATYYSSSPLVLAGLRHQFHTPRAAAAVDDDERMYTLIIMVHIPRRFFHQHRGMTLLERNYIFIPARAPRGPFVGWLVGWLAFSRAPSESLGNRNSSKMPLLLPGIA